jgi:hypothetical protein
MLAISVYFYALERSDKNVIQKRANVNKKETFLIVKAIKFHYGNNVKLIIFVVFVTVVIFKEKIAKTSQNYVIFHLKTSQNCIIFSSKNVAKLHHISGFPDGFSRL